MYVLIKNEEVTKMHEIINKIVQQNQSLFGTNPKIDKINIGFTNTIYNINDLYIVKICTDVDNEKEFKKEIDFYNSNKNNNLIPKLYCSSINKKDVPYFYEIIEKIDGVSLYNVWHTFSEEQREDIIKQLCDAMKQIHSNIGEKYDWTKTMQEKFMPLYIQAKNLNIFNEEEQKLLDYAYSKFNKYLDSNDFVLIHNDLHFDNIFYNDGKIKLIDFERSMYAPRDFELDILYRMIRKPWKFASEETERYTDSSDYTNIMLYIEKYYPELVSNPNLHQRLAIYDMVYFLEQLVKHPELEELKNDVIFGAKVVALKDEITFNDVKTPMELMNFMNVNIEYGWIDNQGFKHLNNLKGFRKNYRISSIDKMLEVGLGTCIEQAKMIKYFFDKMGFENKLYCYRSYETEENFDKDIRMHCFVLFKYNDSWYHFEHSNRPKRGIHKYDSVESAIEDITSGFKEHGDIRKLTEIDSIPSGLTFKEFNNFVNEFDDTKRKKI